MDRRLPLVALVASDALSLTGTVVAAVAVPWFVLVTTGSPARTGLAAFFGTVPLALSALLGGAVVDRVGARTSSVVADLGAAASIAAIPALYSTGRLEYWHVLALAFATGAFDGPGRAARLALVPQLAAHGGLALERANAITRLAEHTGYVLGAPLAGVLIASFGAPGALWADAASFGVSALAVLAGVPRLPVARIASHGYVRDAVAGLRFIAGDSVLRTLLTMSSFGSFVIAPLATVLLPVYARERLGGASEFAALVAAYGVGGLLGAVFFGVAATRIARRALYVGTVAGLLVASVVLVLLPSLAIALAALVLLGGAAGAIGPLEQTVWQERTPDELRARAFAAATAIPLLTDALAFLLAGAVVGAFGLRAGFAIHAVGDAVLLAAALVLPALRRLDKSTSIDILTSVDGSADRLLRPPQRRRAHSPRG